jgi:predicted DNA-binding transcriptional regulator YafY
MDKWEKIVLLHRLLKHSRSCSTLQTIIDKLDCSAATFHRIRAYMQHQLGAPIIYDRRYTGYRYNDTDDAPFELPGLWLTKSEIEALLCLDYAVESLQGGFLREIIAPVKNRFEPLLKAQKTTLVTLRDRLKIIPTSTLPAPLPATSHMQPGTRNNRAAGSTIRPTVSSYPMATAGS